MATRYGFKYTDGCKMLHTLISKALKSHRSESIEVRGLNVIYLIRCTYRKMTRLSSGYEYFVVDNLKHVYFREIFVLFRPSVRPKCVKLSLIDIVFQSSATCCFFFVYENKTTKFAAPEARENLNCLNVNKRI